MPIYSGGGGGSGGASALSLGSATLTDAQVKALPTAAVTVVAAPGAGKTLVPIHCVLVMAGTTDYTNLDATSRLWVDVGGNGDYMTNFDSGAGTQVSSLLTGVPELAICAAQQQSPVLSPYVPNSPAALENLPLVIQASNGAAGNFTGGNAANSLKVSVLYYTLTLP